MPKSIDLEKLSLPLSHLNGSGVKNLMEPLIKAIRALDQAQDALAEATPHGRDYYIGPPDAYQRARDEHQDRRRVLEQVKEELEFIAMHVSDSHRR